MCLFRKAKDKQGLINARTRGLANAEESIELLNREFKDIKRQNEKLEYEVEEKQEYITELKKTLIEIADLVAQNNYGHPEAIINKIKDITREYQTPI